MKNLLKAPVYIPVENIHPFEYNPYKVQDNDEMNSLIESIQSQGILSPIIVRPIENTENQYEVISGHRRLHAAIRAGLKEVPADIYAVDRNSAAIMLVDSNLHREHILPSEKAFAYKLKYDALKHQGKRTDLTSGQLVPKSDDNRTTAFIGEQQGESYKTVQRYLRLTNLIPYLLDLVDEGKIAFSVGVELSYLSMPLQIDLYNLIVEEDCTPSYSQAWNMHQEQKKGTLDYDRMIDIFCVEKPNQRETIKIPTEKLQGKIPSGYSKEQAEDYIIKAVEHYTRYLQKKREPSR